MLSWRSKWMKTTTSSLIFQISSKRAAILPREAKKKRLQSGPPRRYIQVEQIRYQSPLAPANIDPSINWCALDRMFGWNILLGYDVIPWSTEKGAGRDRQSTGPLSTPESSRPQESPLRWCSCEGSPSVASGCTHGNSSLVSRGWHLRRILYS